MSEKAVTKKAIYHNDDSKTMLGFWVYLMTDCVLFAGFFATFAILHNNVYGGQDGKELFNLPFVLTETLILLTSSYTCGLAILAARRQNKNSATSWLLTTFVLGLVFLLMEISEFRNLIIDGDSWHRSGFLSSFFALVGLHGLHITIGLIWIGVMVFLVRHRGLISSTTRRLNLLSMFWHFLDIVWIFIFTFVYLMGVIK